MMTFFQLLASTSFVLMIALGVIRWLGPKWITHKFNERLEEFKRKQEQILETYRYDIQKMFSRAVKVHEQEFAILPKLWDLLQRAKGAVYHTAVKFNETPDLEKFSEKEFEIFLAEKILTDFQRESLRASKDKNRTLVAIETWYKITRAETACLDLRNYYLLNRIFLGAELEEEVGMASNILTQKSIHAKVSQQALEAGAPPLPRDYGNEQTHLDKIERLIQKRLRFEEA